MALIGDVKLTNKEGMFLGEVSLSNVNLAANEVVYSSDGISLNGTQNFTFDGTSKLHLGGSLLFLNSYQTNIQAVCDANQSTQNLIFQNKSGGSFASTNLYVCNDSTTNENYNYCVIGMNGSNYSGVDYVSEKRNGMYIANTDSDLAIIANSIGNNAGLHLSADGGSVAISLNPNNALSLGTTYSAATDTFTYNCGNAGQVLTSAGTGAIPTWTTPSSGISIANQANTRIPFETATSNALDSSANLTFNSSTNTLSATNVSLTNINGSAYAPVSVANQADNRIITSTGTTDALNGEANLSFNGTTLTQGSINYNVASEAVQITDGSLTGNQNIAIGHKCRGQASSVCLGYDIGKTGMSGNYNVLIGRSTATGLTTGNGLVIIGGNASQALTTATNNTIVGVSSGSGTTQSNNTIVGYNSNTTGTLGTYSNCSILGANIRTNVISADNQVQLGDSTTTTYAYGAVQNRSDARDKTDIRDTILGLDFINELRPVDFRWDLREDYKISEIDENHNLTETIIPKDGSKKRNRYHHGVIAQEVKATMDKLNVDFGGIKTTQ